MRKNKYEQFVFMCVLYCQDYRTAQRNGTRLWNWADHQEKPEIYWEALRQMCPELFFGNSYNDFYFAEAA